MTGRHYIGQGINLGPIDWEARAACMHTEKGIKIIPFASLEALCNYINESLPASGDLSFGVARVRIREDQGPVWYLTFRGDDMGE